jgi:hypothetical protein
MRTVFWLTDDLEDGFAFLSDAFIRQLVGPASKIKEKRRLEALTSLAMVTNAALFSAWETGKLPADHAALLAASALKAEEIYTPEGKGVIWDATHRTAVSDVYNTLHFATPLIELPINTITMAECKEYMTFRDDYLKLWRQYFDPVGMRFFLNDQRVRVETYILPLIQSNHYATLRQWTADGTAALDPLRYSRATLMQGTIHLGNQLKGFASVLLGGRAKVGDWLFVRVDDSPVFNKLAEMWVQQEFEPKAYNDLGQRTLQPLNQLPITLGIQVRDPDAFRKALHELTKGDLFTQFTGEEMKPYQGETIIRLTNNQPASLPSIVYVALIEDVWCLSLSDASLKAMIDEAVSRGERKAPATSEPPVQMNGSVYLAPFAAKKAEDALRFYLEWASHRRALINGPMWYALYRGGLIDAKASEQVQRATARHFLGFVPVSPDGAAFAYDATTDEVANKRHGSVRQPRWRGRIEAASPLGQLLEQFRTLRADLRFQEDGINTTVTIERQRNSPRRP